MLSVKPAYESFSVGKSEKNRILAATHNTSVLERALLAKFGDSYTDAIDRCTLYVCNTCAANTYSMNRRETGSIEPLINARTPSQCYQQDEPLRWLAVF